MEENKNLEDNNVEKNNQNEQVKIEEKRFEVKNKFVPSYQNKEKSNASVDKKKKNDNKKRKSFIWIIILAILLILLGFGVYKIVNHFKYKKYEQYSNKMIIYGFGNLYDNNSITEYNKITKSEAIKMVISATLNISNIDKIIYIEEKEYENQAWVEYAISSEIISKDEINKDNYNKKATVMDCLKYMYMAKLKILNKDPDIEATPEFYDFSKYTNEEQLIIKDMVWNKIIENNSKKLNAYQKIKKGELNKLIILFSEKNNTITEGDAKLNINGEKLPSNYTDYPYCLANVNKNIYETRFIYSDVSKFKKPVEIYAATKENWYSLDIRVKKYLLNILNVNYNIISEEELKTNLSDVFLYNISDKAITDYVKFVKDNHIIIKGNINIIYPVFYFDGNDYRIRCTVSYDVLSADTLENILFGDDLQINSSIKYVTGNNSMIIDIPVNRPNNNDSFYIRLGSLVNYNVEKENNR